MLSQDIPLIGVLSCIGLVQQVCVLHDFCHFLQHAEWLHDEQGHAHQAGHIHTHVLAELAGLEQDLPDLYATGM